MSSDPNDHRPVLASVETTFADNGFDVERVEYDEDHEAVVVQYATIVGGADEIRAVLAADIPKTVGAFEGAVRGADAAGRYTEMVVLAVNSRTTPAERTGKLRWEIGWDWLPEEDVAVSAVEYESVLQNVLSTAVVVTEDGTHEVDAAFEFTDT